MESGGGGDGGGGEYIGWQGLSQAAHIVQAISSRRMAVIADVADEGEN